MDKRRQPSESRSNLQPEGSNNQPRAQGISMFLGCDTLQFHNCHFIYSGGHCVYSNVHSIYPGASQSLPFPISTPPTPEASTPLVPIPAKVALPYIAPSLCFACEGHTDSPSKTGPRHNPLSWLLRGWVRGTKVRDNQKSAATGLNDVPRPLIVAGALSEFVPLSLSMTDEIELATSSRYRLCLLPPSPFTLAAAYPDLN
ncbi:hypothetical protein BKA70DRAFT_1243789 [Coprinopsis sp. MPI-PUGE-AT-0042]|nr:hypothetical protein BKA70DRAFT_1243789 [Coprinopsis sp. MPI-PUGE-AT-0042]